MIRNDFTKYITKTSLYLSLLAVAGIFYRSYLHLFVIPRWIIEEEDFAFTIIELVRKGFTERVGYQPILEQYLIYYIHLITHINPIILCQYANPIVGGLTIIPIYLVFKKISTKNIAIIATTLWTFNENMIYRSSTFNSTEPFGFFLAIFALLLYLNIEDKTQRNSKIKLFCGFLVLIVISIFVHILPAVFIIGVVSLDIFLKGSTKLKIFVILGLSLLVSFLYSPLNPSQVMMNSILPSYMLSQFNTSNIFLYSPSDLLLGVSLFFSSVVLIFLSVISIILYKPKTLIMFEYIFGCILLFITSWMFYSGYLIGPTRVVLYFILPLSYFTAILISKLSINRSILITAIVVIIMILTSMSGVNKMLYINNTMTLDEYEFLDQSAIIHSTYDFRDWWTDMPLKSSILLYSSDTHPTLLPITFRLQENQTIAINLNQTITTSGTKTLSNGTVVTIKTSPTFKYIIISPRMEKSAYFHVNTKYRTIQLNTPVVDVWKDMPDWKLVEEYKNIKIYKWFDIDIEG